MEKVLTDKQKRIIDKIIANVDKDNVCVEPSSEKFFAPDSALVAYGYSKNITQTALLMSDNDELCYPNVRQFKMYHLALELFYHNFYYNERWKRFEYHCVDGGFDHGGWTIHANPLLVLDYSCGMHIIGRNWPEDYLIGGLYMKPVAGNKTDVLTISDYDSLKYVLYDINNQFKR